MKMTYARHVETRPLTREEAERLVGSIARDGRMLTVEEILADSNLSRVTRARDIHTGEMKEPRSGMFINVKAG